jgi:hypothetical protein
MKTWNQEERLKAIKHTADTAKTESRKLAGQGRLKEAVDLFTEALVCIQAFAARSDQELDADRARYARFL